MSISVRDFEERVLNLINAGELNTALNLIIDIANEIAYGKEASILTVTSVFGSKDLDRLCQNIGAITIKQQKITLENRDEINDKFIVYIASELYISGGHTAVIEDFIKARPDKKHVILIVDTFNTTNKDAIENRFSSLNVELIWGPNGSVLDKLYWLQYVLSTYHAAQLFLFNHPHDAVAIAAVQPSLTPNLIFYHHAAHIFSLGVYLSHSKHIDFSPASFFNCRENLRISNNIYVPLVINDIVLHSFSDSFKKTLRTCSSISENKLKGSPYLYSYIDEIPNIISAGGGEHVHIGDLLPSTLSYIKNNLQSSGISPEKFIHVPWVKSLAMAMSEYKVNIYLDSFPLGGGKSVIEAMASGIPIIAHNNYRNRQLCATDIIYPEAFRWQKIDELYQYLGNVDLEMLKMESSISRSYYEKNYKPEILTEFLISLEKGEATALPDQPKHYSLDDLQSFFDRLISIRNISDENKDYLMSQAKYEIERNSSFSMSKICQFDLKPVFSIVFPVFNTPEKYLRAAIESVINQVYLYWELCIADDKSTEPHVKKILQEYTQRDSRIKIIYRTENGHISRTSNSAIEIATGEFIALLDHDDLLTSDALYEMALLINQHPDADMIYSDEDKVNDNNKFLFPTNKPDWCPDSFLSRMYTCHLGVYRRSLINEIGGFRVGYEGSQDYDLVLRITEKTDKIFHIPKILYHWRLHAGSTSASTTAKTYAYEAGFKALTDALNRRGENGKIISDPNIPGHYHARYEVQDCKLVSIIILACDSSSTLDGCLESIFRETLYLNYEVVIVGNNLTNIEVIKTIDKWKSQQSDRLKHYSHGTSFNSSELNNYAVTKAQGDYLLFLSSDIQITQDDWLDAMVEQAQRTSIGAVGAFLLDSYGAIQHVGSVLGLGEIASHIYKGVTKVDEYETLAHIVLIKNVSVITIDCLICRRDVFTSIDGFDETLPIFYNEVDLCLKMVSKGYRNIILPHVKLTNQELTTWQVTSSQKERCESKILAAEILEKKWGKVLTYDPCISQHIIRDINAKMPAEIACSSNSENPEVEQIKSDIYQPLVSVCIPTYNGAQFIEEAISSVLSQTYTNLEIIISDDGSTDRTIEIAKSLQAASSAKFSILEHSQYGLAQNWNFCISQAQGKYIKFLFQDDILLPDAIEEMVAVAEQDPEIGLVFSPRVLFTETGNSYDATLLANHEARNVHQAWSNLKSIQSGSELLKDLNILSNPINKIGEPSTVLIKKEVFDAVGLFNSDFYQLVDLEMWFRIMSQYKVGFVDRILSKFRIHAQQQTQKNSLAKETIFLDYQRFFQTISDDLRYPQSARQEALYRYAALRPQGNDLEKLCKQMAEESLKLSASQLVDWNRGWSGKTQKILQTSGIKYISLPQQEQSFVDNLVTNLKRGLKWSQSIQTLFALMPYYRAYQLPLQHDDLCHVPDWFMSDYLQFLFSAPVNFTSLQEADNYHSYIQGWIDYLHKSILTQPENLFWRDIASKFARIANFIPVYFNETNLKDIYVKRAEIIELYLKNNKYEVDYQFEERPVNRKKIRLGIIASHYLPSAETFAALPAYEYLSRDFEVVLYSLQETGQPLEQYCFSCANHSKLLPQNLAEQVSIIRADDLDILFFGTNVTVETNPMCLLASHRLARIQVTSGASVVTTGMRYMDYFISATLTDPSPVAQDQYREELKQLVGAAHCFSYGDDNVESTIKVDRSDLNISPESIVFISGANFFKIIPELVHTWAKIIALVPKSTLMLLPYGPNWSNSYPKKNFRNNLNEIFLEYGISTDRLIILDPQPVPNREGVKAYYQIADVCLDSYPFAGTTSLIEPLQVNLPVIARQGNSFRSSMGAAMIRSLDIPDLVADSEESYIQLAVALGNNPALRQQKRNEIKAIMADNPSFLDSKGYGAKIGDLFKELLDRYLAKALSDNLRLRDVNLMVFPDWNQSEESVGLELQQVIQTLATQPDSQKTTLLIDTTDIAIEDAEMFISSVAMNLMMEEDIDITEELEISLIEDLNNIQWQNLLPKIDARIILECDNQAAVARLPQMQLPQRKIESFVMN